MPIGDISSDDGLRARSVLFEALLDALPISDTSAWRLVDAIDTLLSVRQKTGQKREGADVG